MIGAWRRRRQRRRALCPIDADLRHAGAWRVDVRVPTPVGRLETAAVGQLDLPGLVVVHDPPADGMETQLSFLTWATSDDAAVRYGRRVMERASLCVLAIRAVRP